LLARGEPWVISREKPASPECSAERPPERRWRMCLSLRARITLRRRAIYDPAVSGADPIETRPGFNKLLDRIEGNGVRVVIIEDASRFGRDLRERKRAKAESTTLDGRGKCEGRKSVAELRPEVIEAAAKLNDGRSLRAIAAGLAEQGFLDADRRGIFRDLNQADAG
jgi:Resolvase, N terminal domain